LRKYEGVGPDKLSLASIDKPSLNFFDKYLIDESLGTFFNSVDQIHCVVSVITTLKDVPDCLQKAEVSRIPPVSLVSVKERRELGISHGSYP